MEDKTPQEPTMYPPGTSGKIETMAERAALGKSLFHPEDDDWDGWYGHQDKHRTGSHLKKPPTR